jgi:hypothetical protein
MKTVLTPENVAHYFANKLQENARNSGRTLFFENKIIYSYGYHFPIAKHYENFVLFTTRGYSNTTAKHISLVRSACSHLNKVFAPYIDGSHERNFEIWKRNIETNINSMKTARKPEKYFSNIEQIKNEAQRYCEALKVKPTKELKKLLNITFENAEALSKKQAEEEKKKTEIIKTKGKKIFNKYLSLWRSGQSMEAIREQIENKDYTIMNKYISLNDYTYLRVYNNELETSKGIKMPVDIAKRYLNAFINNAINKGDKILNYTVNEVNKNGIKIGCHNINIEQIEYLKTAL